MKLQQGKPKSKGLQKEITRASLKNKKMAGKERAQRKQPEKAKSSKFQQKTGGSKRMETIAFDNEDCSNRISSPHKIPNRKIQESKL